MKGNLFIGRSSGRLGDVVAKIVHGEQIYSKYQPQVFNPNTIKQAAQRSVFANAAIFAKNALIDKYVSNTYAVLRGSARSFYLNLLTLLIFSQRMKAGASNYSKKISLPLMIKNINGNIFEHKYQIVANGVALLIDNALPLTNKIYFGSISKITSTSGRVFGVYTLGAAPLGMASLITAPILIEQDIPSLITERKTGFQNSVEECGSWPYVYSMSVDNVTKSIFSQKPDPIVVDNESVNLIHLVFTTDRAEVFGYDIAQNILPQA